jgi:phage terminase small subunit
MPRPPQPAEILELKGSFKQNPNRRRPPCPKSDQPIGDPPAWMSAALQRIWHEIISESVPGVLTRADRGILSLACYLETKLRAGTLRGPDIAQYRMCRAEIGMSPVARQRLTAQPKAPEADDPFLKFASRGGRK